MREQIVNFWVFSIWFRIGWMQTYLPKTDDYFKCSPEKFSDKFA